MPSRSWHKLAFMSIHEHHSAVGTALDRRRLELGWRWRDIADRAGVSPETLRRLRQRGLAAGTDALTITRIERAVGWQQGSIQAIEQGGEPIMDWPSRDADAALHAAGARSAYLAAAERMYLGDGYGEIWMQVIQEVEPELADATRELDETEEEELLERVKQNIIRQTRLFLDMERERGKRVGKPQK